MNEHVVQTWLRKKLAFLLLFAALWQLLDHSGWKIKQKWSDSAAIKQCKKQCFWRKTIDTMKNNRKVDVSFLLLFTALWATCIQKSLKRHEAKVSQSVVNSSKNETSTFRSFWSFLSFFFKNHCFLQCLWLPAFSSIFICFYKKYTKCCK